MNSTDFTEIVLKQFERCHELLNLKESEYSEGKDRLDQFKKGAAFRGKHSYDVLAGMMLKHTTSIYDLINKESEGFPVGIGMWEEKITDHINYLLLLLALIIDVQSNKVD